MVKLIRNISSSLCVFFFLLGALVFSGCSFGNLNVVNNSVSESGFAKEKKLWTVMVYMAADNNLESAALEDFNEMEASNFDSDKMNVIVLLDRNNLKDCSDSDEWNGTRAYEIFKDKNGMNNSICSKRISIRKLGIGINNQVSLDMGNSKTMSDFISSVVDSYPAEHYGMFVWGHGTGYRSSTLGNISSRAVALDDTSDSFMENCVVAKSIANGMKYKKIDFVAYDTCFAGELEVAYEFPDVANYFCGPQGIQKESGLDYKKVFSLDIDECNDGISFIRKIEEKLSDEMKKDFSIIDLSEIRNVFSEFDNFALSAASNIVDKKNADDVKKLIINEAKSFKSFEAANNPVYVNILSFANLLTKKYPGLESYEKMLRNAITRAVMTTVEKENLPLGVFLCSVDQGNNLVKSFSPFYYRDSNLLNQCSFVKKSLGYVLTNSKEGTLMDRIFDNYTFN